MKAVQVFPCLWMLQFWFSQTECNFMLMYETDSGHVFGPDEENAVFLCLDEAETCWQGSCD